MPEYTQICEPLSGCCCVDSLHLSTCSWENGCNMVVFPARRDEGRHIFILLSGFQDEPALNCTRDSLHVSLRMRGSTTL